ncbi:MAG TPA: hypothetical protein VN702_21495 [Acetobacteraceae bacterium]|nr:hypothetical protein [Acetobacteraceae bacterium]
MRYVLALLIFLIAAPAWGDNDLVLPTVEFSATAVHQSGAYQTKDTIYYAGGKLRIERGHGFTTTILDLTTRTQCILMVNHTYLILPMDDELFRRFIAQTVDTTGATKVGTAVLDGMQTTKYAFGDAGELKAAGYYWLTKTGIMIRRDYDDGVYGQDVHHKEFLTNIKIGKQPLQLFGIPAGYTKAK